MEFEEFGEYMDSLRTGCMNRLSDLEPESEVGEYNWYAEKHNDVTGTFMALQTQYYDSDGTTDD